MPLSDSAPEPERDPQTDFKAASRSTAEKALTCVNWALLSAAPLCLILLIIRRTDVGFFRVNFSITEITLPGLLLVSLYVAKCLLVHFKKDSLRFTPRNYLKSDIPFIVFFLSLAMFFSLKNRIVDIYTPAAKQCHRLTGDEPSYMLICQSIVLDRDVNLWNDAMERRGITFGHPRPQPHKATFDRDGKVIYSIHPPGLPCLLSPFFALAMGTGLTPRFVCTSVLNILAAVFAVLIYRFAFSLSKSRLAAMAVAVLAACTCPLFIYSGQLYPELTAGLLMLCAFFLLLRNPTRSRLATAAEALFVGACLAALPWMHIRFAVFSFLGLIVLIAYRRGQVRYVLIALFPLLVSATALTICHNRWYGSPWPHAAYVAQGSSSGLSSSFPKLLRNLLGILLDSGCGLLTWCPWLVFVPAGIWFSLKERKMETVILISGAAVYLAVIASFSNWWGGFCPPNRFLVVLIPLLAAWTAVFLSRNAKKSLYVVFSVFAMLSVFFILRCACLRYTDLYSKRHVLDILPLWSSNRFVHYCMPRILFSGPAAVYKAIIYLAVILLANVYAVVPTNRHSETAH